jgi:SAM-dependent methyltransferase
VAAPRAHPPLIRPGCTVHECLFIGHWAQAQAGKRQGQGIKGLEDQSKFRLDYPINGGRVLTDATLKRTFVFDELPEARMNTAGAKNRRYFRDAYRTGGHGWETEEPSPFALDFLGEARRQHPGGNFLDIGCGEGRHCIAAARMGFNVTGIDYEPLALARAARNAKARGARGITFRRANALALPFGRASFDVLLDYGCLHHQKKSDWRRYRANIQKVLRPGGFYILSVFAPGFHLFGGTRRPWHIARGAYRRYFKREEIVSFLSRDFEILQLELQNRGEFWHALARRGAAPDTD